MITRTNGVWLLLTVIFVSQVLNTRVSDEPNIDTLKLVMVLHRHGIRAPEATWPTDPYRDEERYWKVGWNQLLPQGKREMYRLGKTLSRRYRKFIDEYTINTVRVRSSDNDRCLMSVGCLLSAWFPPRSEQIWNPELMWQPIPIHTLPTFIDWILAKGIPCPKYDDATKKVITEMKANETNSDREFYAYLDKHMNQTNVDFMYVGLYYTTMVIEESVGYKLPEWTKAVYPEKMRQKAFLSGLALLYTPYQKKMAGGAFLQELLNKMKHKRYVEDDNKKLLIYSGHDYDEAGAWVALGLPLEEIFPTCFGSALVFELHKWKDNDDYFIKMFRYNDSSVKVPYEVQIPNCGDPCSLSTLFDITNYMRSADPVEDCITENN